MFQPLQSLVLAGALGLAASTAGAADIRWLTQTQENNAQYPIEIAAIDRAKANGSWTLLDAVERLEVPDDLAAALAATPAAQAGYDDYPPSIKKQALWWVVSAKRPRTRADRIEKLVSAAARGERGWPQ